MMTKATFKSKVFIDACIAAIALLGLTTGTYAWFAVANSVGVETFKITYGEADKIQFGLIVPPDHPALGNAGDLVFFDDISEDDLIAYDYLATSSHLSPVSAMFQSRWLTETTDLSDETLFPVLRKAYSSYENTTDSSIASTGFFQFEFYLKSNMDMYLYLDDSATVLPDTAKNEIANPSQAAELNKISDSLRVSFLSPYGFNIWEPNTETAGTTSFGGRIDVLTPDGFYDFTGTPGNYNEILFGDVNDPSKAMYSENARAHALGTLSSFNASTADNVLPLDLEASISNGLVIAREQSKSTATLTNQSIQSSALAYLPEYTPTRLVISVYAEGWDLDTINMIETASFLLNLTLTGRYRAPTEPLL